ncbi:MAG: hypothetical protein KKA05_04535 [Alphaproteobacteria bacterium]|nr:hypothetical protein [Alphaproteobacteria bacterium]
MFKDENARLEARALLLRSRLYRMFALVSAFVGLIIFIILYMQTIEGRLEDALREPQTIAIIIVPFLPAVVLSIMAERAQKKFDKFVYADEPGTSADAKKKK